MLVAAERYDADRMTAGEYEAEKAGATADFKTSLLQRRNNTMMAIVARTQADAAQRQAITAAMPRFTACTAMGHMVTCH